MKFEAKDFTAKMKRIANYKEEFKTTKVIITAGEREIFEMCKQLEVLEGIEYQVRPKSDQPIKYTYKGITVEIIPAPYKDNRYLNKEFHPDGGLTSSYECDMIFY